MQHAQNYRYIFLLGFFAAIAGLLFGFDTGIISGALQFIATTFHLTKADTFLQECIVASVPFGALLGAICSYRASMFIGRRNSIMVTAILFVIGTLFAALAINVWMIIVGRLIMGFAVGLSAMVVPMYMSEIAPPKIRGAIVFLFQLAITIGLMMAFIMNYIFAAQENWRWMFGVGLIPSIGLVIGVLILPYSPRWLIMKGREQHAIEVLKKLRGHEHIQEELADIKASVKHCQGTLKMVLSKPLRTLVVLTFGLFIFQQLSGVNTILYYAPTVFQNAGYQGNSGAILASVATGVTFVIATIFAVWVVDILGRRKLFAIGFSGMIICLATMGAGFHGWLGDEVKLTSLIAVLGFIAFFGISLGPLCYLMMSELFPLNFKGIGMAIASCANWGSNILVSSTFLTLVNCLGIGNTFFLYAGLTVLGFIFTMTLVPETKGVSLERIEANLYQGKPVRKLGM